MCTTGDRLTPRARVLVEQLLGHLADGVAAMCGADPGDVVIGPVDIDGDVPPCTGCSSPLCPDCRRSS